MDRNKNSNPIRQDRAALLATHRATETRASRKRKLLWSAGGITTLAVAGTLVAVAVVNDPAPQARQDIEIAGLETFEDLDAEHVSTPVDYDQGPPVGGTHSSTWLNCGTYTQEVPEENAVHSLEHGAIWVTYDPETVPQDQVDTLQSALPETYVVLSPYQDMDSPITLSAWGAQMAVETPDDERVEQFVSQYWQSPNAPEPGASCTGGLDAPGRAS
ncbi:DUF3105 domain-containing protein [Nesterenkonia sp. E16_7]|uniref:DUF3105 domain-containing protein n=1 Tax=unclassified Nesterenkonia TaxID=2629769 RepID=UPI001A90DD38|nr:MULTISPECIES: DUF3105 domain-containing protein [unclassified Nesterenkonia]MBO0596284.1 DUF3105 domain-containing protein [Nesterenkonia sp. E16_10]MBO0599985.1 DUF3105 domain-containing protein [Nesterenkonia sp. E16_7]